MTVYRPAIPTQRNGSRISNLRRNLKPPLQRFSKATIVYLLIVYHRLALSYRGFPGLFVWDEIEGLKALRTV